MPSQMFEEWLRDKEMLKKVTKHYQTGESMPDEMIDKLLSLVVFDSGAFIARQLKLSELSLRAFSGQLTDPEALEKELFDKYLPKQCHFAPENKSYANFGHLTEYSCKYYGYLWSRVFSLDLAEHVRERGLLNSSVGKAFGENVLGVGAAQDPDDVLEKFLGRKPRQDAFLKAYGLKK
jgi:Zn-dependent oligopeptidase